MMPGDKTWWKKAFSAAEWLRNYHRAWFRLDFLAGITLAAHLLPAALGDASLGYVQAAQSIARDVKIDNVQLRYLTNERRAAEIFMTLCRRLD
jgi:hypothetical protein